MPLKTAETDILDDQECRCVPIIWAGLAGYDTHCVRSARIFASQPLRAKEASPLVAHKYPVIVRRPPQEHARIKSTRLNRMTGSRI